MIEPSPQIKSTLKSVAHQIVLDLSASRTVIGLNQQNGEWLRDRILTDLVKVYLAARHEAQP